MVLQRKVLANNPPLRRYHAYDRMSKTYVSYMLTLGQFRTYPSSGIDQYKMQFVPMMWGNAPNDLGFYDKVKGMIDGGMNISYVLGFNEPDICMSD